jgi:glutamine---fructose-6-phosphate transaminase (isomerizing)
MCGIVGYVGHRDALSLILAGLRRLEYRGCDSAGLALVSEKSLDVRKTAGKVADLEALTAGARPNGVAGIGHTRWATHGRPSDANAHPHTDCQSRLAVVHNGIVENYRDLRRSLAMSGHRFRSQTDTEVIAHLIERYQTTGLTEAARRAAQELEGTNSVACVAATSPNTLIAFRRGSAPLVVGYGHGEMFVASDIPALLDITREILVLDDGELAVLTPQGISVRKLNGNTVRRRALTVGGDGDAAEKSGYPHFMLKEIFEQPEAVRQTLCERVDPERPDIWLSELGLKDRELSGLNRLCFVGCGTSWHAGLLGKYLVEEFARLPVEVDLASEFRYRRPVIDSRVLTVPISQSGETVDTLAALQEALGQGSRAVAICNVVGSSLARHADGVVYTRAGVEIGGASTKAFSAQLVAVTLLALKLGLARGFADPVLVRQMVKGLIDLPDLISVVLQQSDAVRRVAERVVDRNCFMFVGQGLGFPLALEGARKLRETSLVHAEGHAAGEMKHGPLALINRQTAVVAIAPRGSTRDTIAVDLDEIRSRAGVIVALVTEGDGQIGARADAVITIPASLPWLQPLLATVPLQLLAYHLGVLRGREVDQVGDSTEQARRHPAQAARL